MNHGIITEDTAELICYRLFGPDLVLRSPKLVEKSGIKELTDILVIIDETILIFQSKSLLMDAGNIDSIKLKRINKRHIIAKNQINTTLNAQNRNAEVHTKTPFDVEFTVDWSYIRKKTDI